MSDAGKITVRVTHSRNQETIAVSTVGMVGSTQVNTIRNTTTYQSRTAAPDAVTYWTGILNRAITQLSS